MKMASDPFKRSSLSDNLVEHIVQLIRSEGYKSGDKLPSISVLAQRFGVGHPTLREALRKLEAIGIVEIKHGSGVYLKRDKDILLVSNPISGGPISKKLLLDLLEARVPIEVKAVGLAASNASEANLDTMAAMMQKARLNLKNDAVLSPTNLAFHCEIAAASGNSVLVQLLEVLNDLFREEHRMILNIYGDRGKDHLEHVGILEALQLRDKSLAEERMELHLKGVKEVLQKWDPRRKPLS